jgi:integrase
LLVTALVCVEVRSQPLGQWAPEMHVWPPPECVTSSVGDRVFTNGIGDPMRPGSVGQAFGRLVASAGVPRIRLHDLHHTHASHLLMAGANVNVFSERLGHASASFTLDTYGHVMPGQHSSRGRCRIVAAMRMRWFARRGQINRRW